MTELAVAAALGAADAPEQDCVARSGSNLLVAEAGARRSQVALTEITVAVAPGAALTPEQACVALGRQPACS